MNSPHPAWVVVLLVGMLAIAILPACPVVLIPEPKPEIPKTTETTSEQQPSEPTGPDEPKPDEPASQPDEPNTAPDEPSPEKPPVPEEPKPEVPAPPDEPVIEKAPPETRPEAQDKIVITGINGTGDQEAPVFGGVKKPPGTLVNATQRFKDKWVLTGTNLHLIKHIRLCKMADGTGCTLGTDATGDNKMELDSKGSKTMRELALPKNLITRTLFLLAFTTLASPPVATAQVFVLQGQKGDKGDKGDPGIAKSLVDKLALFAKYLTVTENTGKDKADLTLKGVNLNIQSGAATPTTTNGYGNLVVGVNGQRIDGKSPTTTGSHNIIVGTGNSYTSYGGLVVGQDNTISGPFASVSAGHLNTASGLYSSVNGGATNTASGKGSSVCGGGSFSINTSGNKAKGELSTITAGQQNTATGFASGVHGGMNNFVYTEGGAILGGFQNYVGLKLLGIVCSDASVCGPNGICLKDTRLSGGKGVCAGPLNATTAAKYATIAGGAGNLAWGPMSHVSGGVNNNAIGEASSVLGGNRNQTGDQGNAARGYAATVCGGDSNTASGTSSSVSGGGSNQATSNNASVCGGLENQATANNSTVLGGQGQKVMGKCTCYPGTCAIANSGKCP